MNSENPDIRRTISGLKLSIYDGLFAQGFAILTGSIFLPAFALTLHASTFQIGLLAAIPFFATIFQIIGAWFIEKYQGPKKLVLFTSITARSLWIPLTLTSMFIAAAQPGRFLVILIGGVVLYHIFGAISGVSWLTWMAGLVPEEIRGRYFGLRNSLLGFLTLMVTLGGGYYLDWFEKHYAFLPPGRSFEILFMIAIGCAAMSSIFLFRQPATTLPSAGSSQLRQRFKVPLRNPEFKKFLRFGMLWSFAVNFASPFFIVYLLKDLQLGYTLIGAYTVISALADLAGMWGWGYFSDHMGNRPVIILTAGVAMLLPFLWLMTDRSPLSIYLMIPLLHLVGGFVWAGYNLCSVNLIFRTASLEKNSVYFALWNAMNGILAGLGALSGGLFSESIDRLVSHFPPLLDSKFKLIFLLSGILRLVSLLWIRQIRESKGLPVVKAIRILRSVRSWSTMMGFHPTLQFFLPARITAPDASPYWPLWQPGGRKIPDGGNTPSG